MKEPAEIIRRMPTQKRIESGAVVLSSTDFEIGSRSDMRQ
jgi:hypothetical protein